jgi:hypothetical protein
MPQPAFSLGNPLREVDPKIRTPGAVTLAPAAAWSYELPSLSGSESAGILRFLMTF